MNLNIDRFKIASIESILLAQINLLINLVCGVKGIMKIKNIVLGAILALCLPWAAQAQTTSERKESYDKYQVSCDAGECNQLNVNYQTESADSGKIAQRSRRRRRSKNYYYGGNIGLFFPQGLDVSFGGSAFIGKQFYQNLGADLELLFAIGGDINVFAIMANPRFEFDIEGSNLTAFASPGVGVGIIDPDNGDSDTDISFQVKTGLTFPVGNNKAFGQFRFFNQNDTGGDIYSIEGGLIF